MIEFVDPNEQLRAAVIARLVWLRHANVLHGPCELNPSKRPRGLASPATLLWSWSRLLSDVQQLLTQVLEPATREPGRVHQRNVEIERGRPRGAVHWPRTTLLGMRSIDAHGIRFVCSSAERNLLAPENLLLVWTLDDFLARGLLFHANDLARTTLGDARLDPLHRLRAHLRSVEGTPEFSAWREAVRARRRAGPGVEIELERAVRERVRGRPSAAPSWARALLELRRNPAALPSRAALASIDEGTLWQQLAALELVCVLRRRGSLAQCEHGFVGAHGLAMRAIAGTPAWVITAPDRAPIGVLWPACDDWEDVRRDARHWSWSREGDGYIDRWMVLNRSGRSAIESRPPIELRYCDLQAEHPLGADLISLHDWLHAPTPVSAGQVAAEGIAR